MSNPSRDNPLPFLESFGEKFSAILDRDLHSPTQT